MEEIGKTVHPVGGICHIDNWKFVGAASAEKSALGTCDFGSWSLITTLMSGSSAARPLCEKVRKADISRTKPRCADVFNWRVYSIGWPPVLDYRASLKALYAYNAMSF